MYCQDARGILYRFDDLGQPWIVHQPKRKQDGALAPSLNGEHPFSIERADLRQNKTGAGKHVWIQAVSMAGPHKGRKLFHRFTIVAKTPKVQQRGRRELAQLAASIDIPNVRDTSELIGKPFVARVAAKGKGWAVKEFIRKVRLWGAPDRRPHITAFNL